MDKKKEKVNKETLKAEGYDLVMRIEQARLIITQCQKRIQNINIELNKNED